MKYFLSLTCSLMFTVNVYADVLPEKVIQSQQEDQSVCFQERLTNCLQKCITSSDTNCRDQCETVARNQCRQAGE